MKKVSRCVLCVFVLMTALGVIYAQTHSASSVLRLDPSLDQLVSPKAKVEAVKLDYFGRTEGPIWVPGEGQSGYLLFSDIPGNVIYKWQPSCSKYPCRPTAGTLSVYEKNAGFTGQDVSDVGLVTYNGRIEIVDIGSIGLALDPQGRVLIDAGGDRSVERIEKDGSRTVLADRWEGKRLGCPNDIISKSDGTIYFTDARPNCLRLVTKDPSWEIKYTALYMVKDGVVTLLDKDNQGANGVALSPDEKTLYVTGVNRTLLKYDVQSDDTVTNRRLFVDELASAGLTQVKRGTAEATFPDGIRVDEKGDLWAGGPGGIWVISPQGKHLGTILMPDNVDLSHGSVFVSHAFGDDGKTLYIVGNRDLRRIRLRVCGRSGPPFTCSGK